MELPIELQLAVEKQTTLSKHDKLVQDSQSISEKYRTRSGQGKRLITTSNEAVAYSVVRMPATFGAVHSALRYTLNIIDCDIKTLSDVGAGTGAATWACDALLDLNNIVCLEREPAMLHLGQMMMCSGSEALSKTKWLQYDITKDDIKDKTDMVVASYMLNELNDTERIKAIDKLWNASDKLLLIVEPGTPVGFSHLKKAREYLLSKGGRVVAPCSHEGVCKLSEDDWCHFTCRIQRSKLHKKLKGGDAPYEDEKFAYLAVTHEKYANAQSRVLRHPIVEKGRISLVLCTEENIEKITISKKDGDLYKKAKKVQCGDEISK